MKGEKSEREERKWKVRARQGGERKEVDTVGEVRDSEKRDGEEGDSESRGEKRGRERETQSETE